jgi:hypothetical protein
VIGERDLSVSFMTDFTKESNDVASVAAAGEITARYNDAKRYCKTALARGMDHTLSPTLVCRFTARLACSLIAALSFNRAHGERLRAARQVAGQSSWAHASHAGTGRDTAKRFGVAYDWNRLVSDPVYNTQIGAAEVAALLKEYRGSHIMPRAGYNAAVAASRNGLPNTAIRAIPRSMRSIGSSAFRSPRRATMCSAQWRISRSIPPVSAPAGAQPASCGASRVAGQPNVGLFLKLSSR